MPALEVSFHGLQCPLPASEHDRNGPRPSGREVRPPMIACEIFRTFVSDSYVRWARGQVPALEENEFDGSRFRQKPIA